jgi:hypothetical protein
MSNGVEGFEITPLGTPVNVIWTVPMKPFWPETETVTGALVAACATDSEFDESVIAKSAEGDGGGSTFADDPPPPPHPAKARRMGAKTMADARFRKCPTCAELQLAIANSGRVNPSCVLSSD